MVIPQSGQGSEFPGHAQENVKIWEGIIEQPEPQFYFHRSIQDLFRSSFDAGFVVDGLEEPGFPQREKRKARLRWIDMPEIPPVKVVRMRLR